MPHFRLLVSSPLPGPDNMALDDALLDRARATGECVLRVYAWSAPTLSFGRNQTARGLYDPARLAARGIGVVRRPTGGRAVLHHREITYSVTAPLDALAPDGAPLRTAYARINRILIDGLRALGVVSRESRPTSRAPVPDGAPCFEAPTGGEIVVDVAEGTSAEGAATRVAKLVGSAQWRDDGALLQHGSILVDDDQSIVGALAARPLPAVPAPATLRAVLGRVPSLNEMAEALGDAVRRLEDPAATPIEIDSSLCDALARARVRYADDAWTWRR